MTAAGQGRILVTGASTGIGRASALRLARRGYSVLAGVRTAASAETLRAEAANIQPVLLDVTRPESIADAVEVCGESLAGLVSNAGIAITGPVELVPVDSWRRQFEVNVFGTVAVTQAVLPLLRRARGRIVMVGSIAGRSALPGSGAYDASKYAIEAIADALRMELRGSGISVSLIEAGAVATPLWEKSLEDIARLDESSATDARARYTPLLATLRREAERSARKAISPEKVAKAVEHAIAARRPKTRYVIGADAWLFLSLNMLPDRWRDRVILSQIHE